MSYDGGKGGAGVYQWLINQIPPHRRFISLFLGHCAVMRYKWPAEISIGIEINPAIVLDWKTHTIPDLTIITGDALDFLNTVSITAELDEHTFIYADPPYLLETRSCQRPLYEFELNAREEHRELLQRLKSLRCMVMISGYYSDLYNELLGDWRTSTFQTVNRAGQRATEWVWMNYPRPFELHDYRYLGRDYRERERIKRKKQRWQARLAHMPELERLAMLEAISELRAAGTAGDGEAGPDLTAENGGIVDRDLTAENGGVFELDLTVKNSDGRAYR